MAGELSDVRFLTVAEVAEMMRVSKMTVYRLIHAGEMASVRVGRSFRVPEKAVKDYLDSRIELARDKGYAETIFGRRRYVPELRDRNFNVRAFGERVLAQAAYGRYYQYLALISNEAFSAFDVWVTTDDGVPPSYGDQFVLGLKTRPAATLGFDVEVYYRTLRDLFELDPHLPDVAGLDYADVFRFGDGFATGVEVLFEKRAGRLNGFLAYTLGLTQRRFVGAEGDPVNPDAAGEPQHFSPKYDRRHDVSFVANVELGRGWTLTGAFVYATGQAYTNPVGRYQVGPPFGSVDGDALVTPGLNRSRLPAYHRADVGLTKAGRFFGLGDYELRLQAINVYSRRNVWFYRLDFEEDRPVQRDAIRMLPILPNIALTIDF